MITLQRKLLIRVRKSTIDAGKMPQAMKPDTYYPVVGYSVQKVKRENKGEHEELTGFYFINQRSEIFFVYASYCEVAIDPCCEDVMNTQIIKEGSGNNGAEKGGQ